MGVTAEDNLQFSGRDDGSTAHGTLRRCAAWAPAAAILAATFVAYAPAIRGGYIWDDDYYVYENRLVTEPGGLWRIWAAFETPQYYPLVFTTFWIEARLWGVDEPLGFHVVNVALHGLAAVLVWRLLRRIDVPGAWLAAAVFALHPVQVESVAWITERKNVLSGVCYLAAFLAYVRFDEKRRSAWYAAAILLFVLALLSKTVTCTLPVAILLVMWLRGKRPGVRDLARLAPMFVLGAAFGLLTAWYERHHVGAAGEHWEVSALQRLVLAGQAMWFYAGKLLWPTKLAFIYPRWDLNPASALQWTWTAAAAAVLAATWLLRRRLGRGPLVAVLFFAVTLGPALGFIDVYPMRYSFVADHFQYLASISLIALCVGGAWQLLGRRRTVARGVGGTLVVAVLGVLTWSRAGVYANAETLWRDTIAKNPNGWMPHYNLGVVLNAQGRFEEGIPELAEAVRLEPTALELRYNLAIALMKAKRTDEAIERLREVIASDPGNADALNNLGIALEKQGNVAEAISAYRRAVAARPEHVRALNNLGAALIGRGEASEAVDYLERALARDPQNAEAHNNLGIALAETGDYRDAARHWHEALQIRPGLASAARNLARLLAMSGRYGEAIAILRRGLDHSPNDAGLLCTLAWQLATCPDETLRDPGQAVELARRAVDATRRHDAYALHVLAAAYAAAGQSEQCLATAGEALEAAESAGDTALADEIRQCLNRARAGGGYDATAP